MTNRRSFLVRSLQAGAALAAIAQGRGASAAAQAMPAAAAFEVSHTEAEWKKLLTPRQFDILRQAGTERPYSSPLNDEHRAGRFSCAGCQLELFSSSTKFDSGTGWPSFWKPLDKAVVAKADRSFGAMRTEVLCRRCGGHLGHVFDDGPRPTGLRYCMNGAAMTFKAGAA